MAMRPFASPRKTTSWLPKPVNVKNRVATKSSIYRHYIIVETCFWPGHPSHPTRLESRRSFASIIIRPECECPVLDIDRRLRPCLICRVVFDEHLNVNRQDIVYTFWTKI